MIVKSQEEDKQQAFALLLEAGLSRAVNTTNTKKRNNNNAGCKRFQDDEGLLGNEIAQHNQQILLQETLQHNLQKQRQLVLELRLQQQQQQQQEHQHALLKSSLLRRMSSTSTTTCTRRINHRNKKQQTIPPPYDIPATTTGKPNVNNFLLDYPLGNLTDNRSQFEQYTISSPPCSYRTSCASPAVLSMPHPASSRSTLLNGRGNRIKQHISSNSEVLGGARRRRSILEDEELQARYWVKGSPFTNTSSTTANSTISRPKEKNQEPTSSNLCLQEILSARTKRRIEKENASTFVVGWRYNNSNNSNNSSNSNISNNSSNNSNKIAALTAGGRGTMIGLIAEEILFHNNHQHDELVVSSQVSKRRSELSCARVAAGIMKRRKSSMGYWEGRDTSTAAGASSKRLLALNTIAGGVAEEDYYHLLNQQTQQIHHQPEENLVATTTSSTTGTNSTNAATSSLYPTRSTTTSSTSSRSVNENDSSFPFCGYASPHPNKRGPSRKKRTLLGHDSSLLSSSTQHSMFAERSTARKKLKKNSKVESDMPRRPLTAYNFFFSEEREFILAELSEEPKKTRITSTISKSTTTSSTPEQQQQEDHQKETADEGSPSHVGAEVTLESITKSMRKLECTEIEALLIKIKANTRRILNTEKEGDRLKKSHRKIHGKIPFHLLAKVVGQRWRDISTERKDYYVGLARQDLKRYEEQRHKYEHEKQRIYFQQCQHF